MGAILMKLIVRSVFSILLMALAAAANAQALEFKGLRFGVATMENVREAMVVTAAKTWICARQPDPQWTECTSDQSSYANFEADMRMLFKNDTLQLAQVTVKAEAFGQIQSTFVERYGKPTTNFKSPYKTKGGGDFTNTTTTWSLPTGGVTVRQFAEDINHSSVLLISKEATQYSHTRAKEDANRAKKDI